MSVVVLGAGVIGVTTAWYLRKQGFDVTVIERSDKPAQNTSFANAGQLSYGYAMPWAAPGMPLKALKWLLDAEAPLKIHIDSDDFFGQLSWLRQSYRECQPFRYNLNKLSMLALSQYSKQALQSLREELPGLAFDHQAKGTLQLFRTKAQAALGRLDEARLLGAGVKARYLSSAEDVYALEPGLSRALNIEGALYLPGDETGDCYAFTHQLAEQAQRAGVKFEWNTAFETWVLDADSKVRGIVAGGKVFRSDTVIVCAGSDSPKILKPLGVHLPVYPVKGYSLTFDVQDEGSAPTSTVMDENYKVAITRLGGRVRVGGTAELAGFNSELRNARRTVLEKSVTQLFPNAGDAGTAMFWTGHRPSTPSSVPFIGATTKQGVLLNCGHGTLGWTMACGSAKALAAAIAGKRDEYPHGILKSLP
ncbi:D-amino acid dehydrogenase [Nostoc sp. CHAB 5834]|nr:D-amino acid dehydrogenase [Nostoc sp. CHAB 5834]